MSVRIRNEIVLRAPNRVGLLAEVTEHLYAKSVSVLGIRAYEDGDQGVFMIFTESDRMSTEALEAISDATLSSTTVLSVDIPNDRGQLMGVARALADAGLDIKAIHMIAGDAPTAQIVVNTSDNVAALAVLEKL